MDKQEIKKQRTVLWKIENFTREAVNKYEKNERIISDTIEISLDNLIKWNFRFYPKDEVGHCGFYIHKNGADRDDFLLKINVGVRKYDGAIVDMGHKIEKTGAEFESVAVKSWGWNKFLKIDSVFNPTNKYLTNDTLTLTINLELIQQGLPAKKPRLDLTPVPKWTADYFDSKELSDIKIICSDKKTFAAHRVVLAGRSSVFKTMLTTNMAEKKSNEIIINDIDGDTMLEFMRFIYKLEVDNLDKHAPKLLDCAEKYDLPDLKHICAEKLIEQLSDKNVIENLLLAKLYNERKLMEKCMEYIDTRFWKLKQSEELKKIDSDLLISIMSYMKEKLNGIELTNSL